jgi:hypothetical protein
MEWARLISDDTNLWQTISPKNWAAGWSAFKYNGKLDTPLMKKQNPIIMFVKEDKMES